MNKIEKLGFDNWFWSSSVRSPSDIPPGKDRVDLSGISIILHLLFA